MRSICLLYIMYVEYVLENCNAHFVLAVFLNINTVS
ncbi:hypothetical protein ECH_1095 [Ehrlichia chaffeensis str. Arkansas]|uniref:Uncharacterized protein n=1 Tax=Ehrlichia chaffeensis (strain ATCC CRL-10679 / Arkansas) TaxID=205920 RepID=Q2GFA3_EHRCR|nr:hypothetical protein ECH_1095 [Ehrlichia chaffeensis str. Arkansas]